MHSLTEVKDSTSGDIWCKELCIRMASSYICNHTITSGDEKNLMTIINDSDNYDVSNDKQILPNHFGGHFVDILFIHDGWGPFVKTSHSPMRTFSHPPTIIMDHHVDHHDHEKALNVSVLPTH